MLLAKHCSLLFCKKIKNKERKKIFFKKQLGFGAQQLQNEFLGSGAVQRFCCAHQSVVFLQVRRRGSFFINSCREQPRLKQIKTLSSDWRKQQSCLTVRGEKMAWIYSGGPQSGSLCFYYMCKATKWRHTGINIENKSLCRQLLQPVDSPTNSTCFICSEWKCLFGKAGQSHWLFEYK